MSSAPRIPIERVGAPGEAWIELRGSVLLFHKRSWVAASSSFIPIEWVRVSHGRRRDLRRLWLGLLGVMVAVLTSLPLSLILFYMRERHAADWLLAVPLAAMFLVALGVGLYALALFLRLRDVTVIDVARDPRWLRIAFWRTPRRDPALDGLVARIEQECGRGTEAALAPVHMHHMWYRPQPFRVALIKGMVVSFFAYLALLFLEAMHWWGYGPRVAGGYYALLLVPPLFYLGVLLVRRVLRRRLPEHYRAAVKAHAREDLDAAAQHLGALLEAQPDHDAARLLMIQVATERYDFDDAFHHCGRLAQTSPFLAMRLESTIWGIHRLYHRMQED